MKSFTLFFLIFLLFNLGYTQEKPDSSKTIEGVIIKETYKATFEEEKFPIKLDMDFSNIVQIPESIHWASIKPSVSINNDDWKHFHFNLSTPELTNIQPQPAKVFYVQFKDLSIWDLEIYSSDGSLFKSISGEENPPQSIAWDGIGDNQKFLTPGYTYTYAFNAVDKAGNKRIFPGKTFNVQALYFKHDNKILVGISFSKVFSSDGYDLLKNAKDYAQELASLIRYYSLKGNVMIDFEHPLKNEFLTLVANSLNKDVNFFKKKIGAQNRQNAIFVWIE